MNGKTAKASVKVKPGDVIEIQFGTRTVKVEVLELQETTKKKKQRTYSNTCKVCQTTGIYKSINGYCFQ